MPVGIYERTDYHKQLWKEIMNRLEVKRKISEAMKGNKNHLGKKHSETTKKKIQEKALIRNSNSEYRKYISEKTKKAMNDKIRQKISQAGMGRKLSDQSKRKLSEACKVKLRGRKITWADKISIANRGKHSSPHTEFTSKKMKNLWNVPEWRERQLKKILKGLMKRPTSLEKQFIEIIQNYNLPFAYCGDGGLLIGFKNPDFYETNGKKICIEVANRFHHQGNWAEKRIDHFKKWGWKCLVFFASRNKRRKWKFDLSEEDIVRGIFRVRE